MSGFYLEGEPKRMNALEELCSNLHQGKSLEGVGESKDCTWMDRIEIALICPFNEDDPVCSKCVTPE